MSFAPNAIQDLADYWVGKGGVNLGIVGNTAHTKGYHLGKDRIYDGSGPGVGDSDYSVKTARDKAGLTNAAAALDLGRLNGSLPELRKFSRWLVDQCQHGITNQIREIIYTPDGQTVQRWDHEDNKIHTGPGNGDSSHLTHTHISFYRDTQSRSKISIFQPYFEDAMGAKVYLYATRDDHDPLESFGTGKLVGVHTFVRVQDEGRTDSMADGTNLGKVQRGQWTRSADGKVLEVVVFNHDGEQHLVNLEFVTYKPLPAQPPADCTDKENAAYDKGHAAGYQEGKQAGVTEGVKTGTKQEYERQQREAKASVEAVVHLSPLP